MKVDFVDLQRQYLEIKSEIDTAIANVIADVDFIGGKYVSRFETEFASYVGCDHCVGVGNGTDALFIALKSLGIGPGDEVITAANSFIATAEAITMTGATVKFADCTSDTFTIDVASVAQSITESCKAIIPVHLYGQPADMDPLLKLARQYGLFVIEDAAQAHGALYKGRKVGSLGDIGCFSFYPSKNLGAYGDGGAITTQSTELAQKARMIANHGSNAKYKHAFAGINSRLDGLQAAILSAKLPHIDTWNERRRSISSIYNTELYNLVSTQHQTQDTISVHHLYVIQVSNRDAVQRDLKEMNISTGIHYPTALPFLEAYSSHGYTPSEFPVAHACQGRILSLPIHGSMREDEAYYVTSVLKKLLS